MNKDFWDKLGVIGTFLSTTVLVIFSTLVTMQTNKLSHQVEEFKTQMQENTMISQLVTQISKDTSSNVKFDFALLALERYLRNASPDGKLKSQDKDMLVGFAQSLILDRKFSFSDVSENNTDRILIPLEFLDKYDSTKKKATGITVNDNNKIKVTPADSLNNSSEAITQAPPVSQLTDTSQSNIISLLIKKMVYIQFANRDKRKNAQDIQQTFIKNNWVAPGIEHVNGSYANIIKYFHYEDEALAIEANSLLGNKFKITPSITRKYQKLVPKGQIEIWIANN